LRSPEPSFVLSQHQTSSPVQLSSFHRVFKSLSESLVNAGILATMISIVILVTLIF